MRFIAGESEPPKGTDIYFNGERAQRRTVVEADTETGRIVQIERETDGSLKLGHDRDLIYVERVGQVEFRPVLPSDAGPEDA